MNSTPKSICNIGVVSLLFVSLSSFAQNVEVTLLGTGTPVPKMDRFGAANLVQAGNATILIDAGRGVLQRLEQLEVSYDDLDALFLTHLHSDHVVGLPDLWLTGWNLSNRTRPLKIYGPRGTARMIAHLREAYQFDIDIRIKDDRANERGSILEIVEIQNGVVVEVDGITVFPFDVDHAPVKPAMGYRVEFGGRRVIFSGDTQYSKNLIEHAMESDLIIHEVAAASEVVKRSHPVVVQAVKHHTSPAEAGQIFSQAKPRLAVFSHIGTYGISEEEIVDQTRTTYSGPLVMGEDLLKIVVGKEIEISRFAQVTDNTPSGE